MYFEVPPGISWKIFLKQDLRKISEGTFCSGKKGANRPKSNIETFLVKIFNRKLYCNYIVKENFKNGLLMGMPKLRLLC